MVNQQTLTWLRDERQQIRNRAADLFSWKIIAPGSVLFLFWPIYAIFLDVEHPFSRAFAHGDCILFAALLFLETSVESERLLEQTATMRMTRDGLRLLAFLLIVIFAFWRNDVATKEAALLVGHARTAGPILERLTAYAFFNCAVALLAAACCVNTVLSNVERECSDLFRRIREA